MTKLAYTMAVSAFVAVSVLTAASTALAGDAPTAEETYKEIEATFGSVPTHIKAYPKQAIGGAWAMSKGLLFSQDAALEPKAKALINLAVAAQIPCQYCVWLETKTAKANGATDAEVSEAVAQAAYVRHWSTVLNGLQIDFETFKTEFSGD